MKNIIKNGKNNEIKSKIETKVEIDNKPLEIRLEPTVFFHHRFCEAFPGTNSGVIWFKKRKEITNRLEVLLHEPTKFDISNGHGVTTDPIWWFKGINALFIERFRVLNKGKVLINHNEFIIDKIAAYRGLSYYQDFIYVQCLPDKPAGLYKHSSEIIQSYIKENKPYTEEFGLYKNRLVTRKEYDDGSAIINGKPTNISGVELRCRTLTRYNFIITAKFSPYNCMDFQNDSDGYFVKLLNNEIEFNDFIEWMEEFPRNKYD